MLGDVSDVSDLSLRKRKQFSEEVVVRIIVKGKDGFLALLKFLTSLRTVFCATSSTAFLNPTHAFKRIDNPL